MGAWRRAGSIRSMFGYSGRRRMSGKRMIVGVLCTMCLILGVYLKFFQHESANQLLAANRQEFHAAPAGPGVANKGPSFHRLGAAHKLSETDEQHHQRDTVRVTAAHEHHIVARTTVRTLVDGDNENEKDNRVENGDGGRNANTIDEWADDDGEEDNHREGEEKEANDGADGVDVHQAPDQGEGVEDVPIGRVEGEDEEEEEDGLPDAGGNGGERKEVEEADEEEDARGEGDGGVKEEADDAQNEPNNEEDSGRNGEKRGPHGIKLFDWDKWVKDNDFVELGNIWGYCDDPSPPVIGKVLLLPDDEKGGLKNVLIFNTTIDREVLMGKVEVSIDYNDMHFYTNVFDFEELEQEGDFFKCPVTLGDHYFVREQHLSSLVPKGHYYGEAQLKDQDDRVIICSTMNLQMN